MEQKAKIGGGLGDRHQQIVDGVTTNYTLDLAAGLTQVLDDGTNTYLYGNGRIAQTGSTTEYFLGDALGSVRQLADSAGAVTLTQSYAPYGDVTNSVGTSQTDYAFTGEARDVSGLTYLRARYLDSSTGRFTQRDPSGLEANLYLYAGANPVMNIDPSGLFFSWYADYTRTNDSSPEWTESEMFLIDHTLRYISERYAKAYEEGARREWDECTNLDELLQEKMSPLFAFWYIHNGRITFEKRPGSKNW